MMASRPGARIRPVRKPIANRDGTEFEPCWELLRDALTDIHTKNAGKLSFEQLYRASYKIVLKKKGGLLYERVKAFEENWFRDCIMPRITELITKNLVNIALIRVPGSSAHERREMGERFLRGVRDAWDDHNMSMNMIADILMYLDRAYTAETKQPSIFAATIGLYRDHILKNSLGTVAAELNHSFVVFDLLNAVILDLIEMERDGDIIDRNLMRNMIAMLEGLYETDEEKEKQKLYLTIFEPRYLAASRDFYRKECEKLYRESDASTWLHHAQARLAEEQDRCETTTSHLTSDKIARVVEEELVMGRLEDFLGMEGSGLKTMIDNDRLEDLSTLYKLISRVDPTKAALKRTLQSRVMELGLEIEQAVKDMDFSVPVPVHLPGTGSGYGQGTAGGEDGQDAAEKARVAPISAAAQQTAAAIKWVHDVLRLKDRFDNLSDQCFCNDLGLVTAVTKSFSDFINLFHRSSEFVSLFIDDNLKRGIKGKTEAEVDAVLEKAIILLRYLRDRDMFERYYQKHLARRLLHGRSESQDVEKEMISRMKQEMGNHFTSKFEGMFKDMDLSRDLTDSYRDHLKSLAEGELKQVDLAVNVLTLNNWPPEVMGRGSEEGTRTNCLYPAEIKRLQDGFFEYYLKDRSGRLLTWVSSAGSADIRCAFPKLAGKESGPLSKERRYELNVPTYGMIVLMLFNHVPDGESLTLEEIQAKTNIPHHDLVRTLASLSLAAKARVLVKEPASKTVKAADRFSFNTHFVSRAIRIKAPMISSLSKVEGDDERKETERKNEQTRNHVMDAAIVRIMKQRKELSHSQLTVEAIKLVESRFKPEVTMIKKRIEDLLARDYLERVDGETASYRYLA